MADPKRRLAREESCSSRALLSAATAAAVATAAFFTGAFLRLSVLFALTTFEVFALPLAGLVVLALAGASAKLASSTASAIFVLIIVFGPVTEKKRGARHILLCWAREE